MNDRSEHTPSEHDAIVNDLPLLANGDLDPPRRGAVAAHVESCDECRARLGEYRATLAVLRAADDASGDRGVPESVDAFDGRTLAPAAIRRVSGVRRWVTAAAVFVAFAAGILVERYVFAPAGPGNAAQPTSGAERTARSPSTVPAPMMPRGAIPEGVTEERIERFLRRRGAPSRLSAGLAILATRSRR